MKRYWNLFWLFRRIELQRLFEERGDFYFWTVISVFWTVFNFFFFSTLTSVTNTIGGWTRPELFLLLGIFTIIDSFTWSFMAQNMWVYTESVFSGGFSRYLTLPIDPQFVIMTQRNSYTNLLRFFIGIAAVVISLQSLPQPTLFQILIGAILTGVGCLLMYSLWFIVATLSFWVERLTSINDIVPNMRRIFQLPRTVFQGGTAVFLQYILPLALIASVPAEVFLNRTDPFFVFYLCGATLFFFGLSRLFFKYSIRNYGAVGG